MQNSYTFPAVFSKADDGISIIFPDLPGCLSCADDYDEAVFMAHDALALRLYSDERDHDPIPAPSDPLALKAALTANQILTLIRVDMREVRAKHSTRAISKMVTVPEYLIDAGKEAGVNFSQVLQEALIKKLGIKKR